jgi:hypothetical protein
VKPWTPQIQLETVGKQWKPTQREVGHNLFLKNKREKYKYMWKQLEQLHHEQGQ